jgi:hypothetical protein
MKSLLPLFVLLLSIVVKAQTPISSSITENTTWNDAGSPYIINTVISIADGATLNIGPGVVVKFDGSLSELKVEEGASLFVRGTSEAPIVFTSINDDEYGGAAAGSSGNPAPEDWSAVNFLEGSTGEVDHAVFRYGGNVSRASNFAALQSYTSEVAITNNTFFRCQRGLGLRNFAAPNISGNSFTESGEMAFIKDLTVTVVPDGTNEFLNNALTGIGILQVNYSGNASYELAPTELGALGVVPFIIPASNVPVDGLSVEDGGVLTIQPGVVIKRAGRFAGTQSTITINDGTLIAEGTVEAPIIFTHITDDDYGGDTNNDGAESSPQPGDWSNVIITGENGNGTLSHCLFRYGGAPNRVSDLAALQVTNGRASVQNCSFYKCVRGVAVASGSTEVIVTNNVFEASEEMPVIRALGSPVSFFDNTYNDNGINGIGIIPYSYEAPGDFTLSPVSLNGIGPVAYVVPSVNVPISGLTIGENVSLTLEPGTILKKAGPFARIQGMMRVEGTLTANGTEEDPVVFTSINDDVYGGDTNTDGQASRGDFRDWGAITVDAPGANVTLQRTLFRFGGRQPSNRDASLMVLEGTVNVSEVGFERCTHGLYLGDGSSNQFEQLSFSGCQLGLTLDNEQNSVQLTQARFERNDVSIRVLSGQHQVSASTFEDAEDFEIENLSNQEVLAQQNWWGAERIPEIAENAGNLSFIFDREDDSEKGPVLITPILAPKDTLLGVDPSSAFRLAETTTLRLYGDPFFGTQNVLLKKEGGIIDANSFNVVDSITLAATFDWVGHEPGLYDVCVVTQTGDTLEIPNGFALLDVPSIPFDEWTPFSVAEGDSYAGAVNVPSVNNLFVLMKKSRRGRFTSTWSGRLKLKAEGDNVVLTNADTLFSQKDFDVQIRDPFRGTYLVEIETTNTQGNGEILFTNAPPTLSLDRWTSGEVLRPMGFDWKQIVLSSPREFLYFQSAGFGLHSTIEVFLNDLENPDQKWTFGGPVQGYQVAGRIHQAPAGTYYVRYKDSAVLVGSENEENDQFREYLIRVSASPITPTDVPLEISSLSTYEIGAGVATFSIFGAGFSAEDQIILSGNGQDFDVVDQAFDSVRNAWLVTFDASDLGGSQLVVSVAQETESASSDRLLTVTQPTATDFYDLRVKVVSGNQIRAGRWTPMTVEVTNRSNIDAYLVPVILTFQGLPDIRSSELENFPEFVTDLVTENQWQTYGQEWRQWDDVPIYADYQDSLTNIDYRVVPVLLRKVGAGESFQFTIEVRREAFGNSNVSVRVFQPNLNNQDAAGRSASACANAILDVATAVTLSSFAALPLGLVDGIFRNSAVGIISGTAALAALFIGVAVAGPIGATIAAAVNAAAVAFSIGASAFEAYNECSRESNFPTNTVGSITPEDKYGPIGVESRPSLPAAERQNFVDSLDQFSYRIDYWNREDATTPAAEVFIRDTLSAEFDLTTFAFTGFGFLGRDVKLPGGQVFEVTVDMRPEQPYLVVVTGELNPVSREVYWIHRTLDPETLELPLDPFAGYLPPIDPDWFNVGYVTFDVRPKPDRPSGTVFENQAFVNFDGVGPWGPAPPYGPYTNTYDFDAPSSRVSPIVVPQDSTAFEVSWSGEDGLGAGIEYYTVYVSENGGPFAIWLDQTPEESARFQGQVGRTYDFYAIATDRVGNVEDKAPLVEASSGEITNLNEVSNSVDQVQIIPNPFSGSTTIRYYLGISAPVNITISDVTGRVIQEWSEVAPTPGMHQVRWAPTVPSGVYHCRITAGNTSVSRRLVYRK